MKLLFDENLSRKLVTALRGEYPESEHVLDLGLGGSPDSKIWDRAKEQGFAIVSKDDDFRQRSFVVGAPPKVIWLQVGNAGTRTIADLLRREHNRISAFAAEEESSLFIVRGAA